MKDTTAEIESLFYEEIMKKSGQERLKMGFSMFDMARRQIIAAIRNDNPDTDLMDIKKGIFMRFYGDEFSSEEQRKILSQLI